MLCSWRHRLKPVNDKLKIEIATDEYGFGDGKMGVEKGLVVEIPEIILYFGFHSFAFDASLADKDRLKVVVDFYKTFIGKIVYWESLQDRGRRFKENDKEYVFLNMTDIIAYTDDPDINVEVVDQTGSAGSFNLS